MFIELHKTDGSTITINLDKLEYFVPADEGKHTEINMTDYAGWLNVEEYYEQVKALIANATRK